MTRLWMCLTLAACGGDQLATPSTPPAWPMANQTLAQPSPADDTEVPTGEEDPPSNEAHTPAEAEALETTTSDDAERAAMGEVTASDEASEADPSSASDDNNEPKE